MKKHHKCFTLMLSMQIYNFYSEKHRFYSEKASFFSYFFSSDRKIKKGKRRNDTSPWIELVI